MRSYRDLTVWQKSMNLVILVYTLTESFPKDEIYSLSSQIKRSAISVPSNIAEGYGRNYAKDYSRFLQIARGSLYELQTQLEIAERVKFISKNEIDPSKKMSIEIEKMLNSLISKIKKN